jgi:hypothetical protein
MLNTKNFFSNLSIPCIVSIILSIIFFLFFCFDRDLQVNLLSERTKDSEIVEGDNFRLQFAFNNVLYNRSDYALTAPPSTAKCGLNTPQLAISESNEQRYNYTQIVSLRFSNVSRDCNYNYTLRLKVNNHPHFRPTEPPYTMPTNPLMLYSVNVLAPIKPYFLNNNPNHTIVISNVTTNETDSIVMTTTDIKVESDKTIELNCQSNGRPKPNVIWFKDSQLLNLTDEKFKLNEGSLKIFRTHPVDSGLYECHVTNRYGTLTRSFNVEVEAGLIVERLSIKQRYFIYAVVLVSLICLFFLAMAIIYVIWQKKQHLDLVVIIHF